MLTETDAPNGKSCVSIGDRFGRLFVEKFVRRSRGPGGTTLWWVCKCDCGTRLMVSSGSLLDGRKSCGCLHKRIIEKQLDNRFECLHQHIESVLGGVAYARWLEMLPDWLRPNERVE